MKAAMPEVCVRPPWPDEIPRLADAFPDLAFEQRMHLRVLTASGGPAMAERLVGVAALIVPGESAADASLLFVVRPRFVATPDARRLLSEILVLAAEQNYPAVVAKVPVHPTPRSALLREAGFQSTGEGKPWRLPLEASLKERTLTDR